ncbi:DUF4352 domain-containing protein [Streptomonospora sp. S1-112]|uniref:DUF4352 domain-containing protein n=1 Tax=Streptomonospora mangrovi TaxID=2883123 RepID=A0A9X3NJD8_9ACTN|nr:DUF4352 domain-containing protein [Streptomonospora mangrovi]
MDGKGREHSSHELIDSQFFPEQINPGSEAFDVPEGTEAKTIVVQDHLSTDEPARFTAE